MAQIFKLEKVKDHIYHLEFEKQYDLCMTFLRYQEFLECPNPNFNCKPFTLAKYMAWYTKENGKFTYPEDWGGYNISISIIREVQKLGITDPNMYDSLMSGIADIIDDDAGYLIGSYIGGDSYEHEMVHGEYFVNDEYRNAVNQIIKDMNPDLYKKLAHRLVESGYSVSDHIIFDEINAYAVTGDDEFGLIVKGKEYKRVKKELKALYKNTIQH
jgi:hypothetical protein